MYYNSGNVVREKAALLMASAINGLHVGLTIDVVPLDWPSFLAKSQHRALPVFLVGWAPDYIDADDYVIPFGANYGAFPLETGYNNTQLTDLINSQSRQTDPAQRQVMLNQIVNTINNDSVYCWLLQGLAHPVQRTWVRGYVYNAATATTGYYFAQLSKG
jgi:peptide/nickel transport system substrate-binding protein